MHNLCTKHAQTIAAQSSSNDARNFTLTPRASSQAASSADQDVLGKAVPT